MKKTYLAPMTMVMEVQAAGVLALSTGGDVKITSENKGDFDGVYSQHKEGSWESDTFQGCSWE